MMTVAKKTKKIIKKAKPEAVKEVKTGHFFEATGRRKTAVARVRLQVQNTKELSVNGKPLDKYFSSSELQQIILSSFEKMGIVGKFGMAAVVSGGGLHAQAEAVRHGMARALTQFDPESRAKLKKEGFLTRDSRMRERKKFGLKRARRAPQWTKR